MGTLKSYEESSPKSGYYVIDHIPNRGFATLQTTGVANRLFDWVEFNSGDQLPPTLVRAMLDLNLLWTEQGGISGEPGEVTETSLESLDTHAIRTGLSQGQYRRLVAFCERYDGGRREALQELDQKLNFDDLTLSDRDYPDPQSLGQQQRSTRQRGPVSRFQKLHKRIFVADQQLSNLVQESLRRWGADPVDVLDNPFGPIYAQAFTHYPGSVESLECSAQEVTVTFQAPHPACLFEEAYAPGPTVEMAFDRAQLLDLHYREAKTEPEMRKMFDAAWQAFRISVYGAYPWNQSDDHVVLGEESTHPNTEDVTSSVRYSEEPDLFHQFTIRNGKITDWEVTLGKTNGHKYDVNSTTESESLTQLQELAIREQQLGAYRSVACLKKFLPRFPEVPDLESLGIPDLLDGGVVS